jgi:two-component system, OmpR family, KDP operon response regulator KdpE
LKILLIDDDVELLELLSFTFQRAGLMPLRARTIEQALQLLTTERPDVAVLDLRLEGEDGYRVLDALEQVSDVPVIVLSGLTAEAEKVRALNAGADGYLCKPVSYPELVARVRAALRRRPARARELTWLRAGSLALHPGEFCAFQSGRQLALTPTEFRLLECLMRHQGEIVPLRALIRDVWGTASGNRTGVLRTYIHRLRRKLGDDAERPRLLHTAPRIGVMLSPTSGLATRVA